MRFTEEGLMIENNRRELLGLPPLEGGTVDQPEMGLPGACPMCGETLRTLRCKGFCANCGTIAWTCSDL